MTKASDELQARLHVGSTNALHEHVAIICIAEAGVHVCAQDL